ncbi:MAG: FHA domain-containing protein [Candidatus Hydrogenedentes bacterium]|nr:FHA domain-containing protein [Candidatus Hydrogenedentota bacterium]
MNNEIALQIVQGTNAGKSWPLSTTPLVIGRSADCGIRIVDATISRRHCQVWLDERGPRVRDLGSANETLVNGNAVDESALSLGDEIVLGPYVLRVAYVDANIVVPSTPNPTTSATLALSEAYFISDEGAQTGLPNALPEASQFRELLRGHREFAKCTRVADLIAALALQVQHRFDPEVWWLVRIVGPERRLVPYPQSTGPSSETLPAEDLQKALDNKSGFLLPRRRTREGRPTIETTMIAPLVVADEQIGALAVRAGTPHRVYDEADLEFFIGLAHSFSPYIRAAEQSEQLRRDMEWLRKGEGPQNALVGNSPAMVQVRELITRAARVDMPILILGETGTGKELVARMVHDRSARAKYPYVIVNAAAVPRELFESEMFGHEKGAFTGAAKQKVGYFEEAHNGTLFLDEIGDLAPEHQARILRAIETGRFNRVGGTREISVDVRIVSATNRDLSGDKAAGFRQDLYHRLSGFEVRLPALRHRKSDIPDLVSHFLGGVRRSGTSSWSITPAAIEKLSGYAWPGNVRELRSCIERSAALAETDTIAPDDIVLPSEARRDPDSGSHLFTLADAERHHIRRILKQHNGNISAAADTLKISRVTLYKKINDYRIEF